ncbi:hypothetical protein [Kitasatospora sp. NPDC101183]|uniref:hypothetical protein n=1 Tax=Kitasatospora sp. NPDC101183 TaxID=3364100 RepID=UPI0038202D6E
MTVISNSLWDFNGNGSTGKMSVNLVGPDGSMDVSVIFDGLARHDRWTGVFDDSTKKVTLVRTLPGGAVQVHTGYLGDNDPSRLVFGGSFTESDVPPGAPRQQYGWYAVYNSFVPG